MTVWNYVYQFFQCDTLVATVHPKIPLMRSNGISFLLAPRAIMGIRARMDFRRNLCFYPCGMHRVSDARPRPRRLFHRRCGHAQREGKIRQRRGRVQRTRQRQPQNALASLPVLRRLCGQEGRAGPRRSDRQKAMHRPWHNGSVPQIVKYDSEPPADADKFPAFPKPSPRTNRACWRPSPPPLILATPAAPLCPG